MPSTKPRGWVEVSVETIDKLAWYTGDTIERDPETDRIYLKTSSGWYTAQLQADA